MEFRTDTDEMNRNPTVIFGPLNQLIFVEVEFTMGQILGLGPICICRLRYILHCTFTNLSCFYIIILRFDNSFQFKNDMNIIDKRSKEVIFIEFDIYSLQIGYVW